MSEPVKQYKFEKQVAELHRLFVGNPRNHQAEGRVFTQATFDALPGTVQLGEFCDWTGLTRKEVGLRAESGEIECIEAAGKYRRFPKKEIARLCGFRL
jgi:hypothetical protein